MENAGAVQVYGLSGLLVLGGLTYVRYTAFQGGRRRFLFRCNKKSFFLEFFGSKV